MIYNLKSRKLWQEMYILRAKTKQVPFTLFNLKKIKSIFITFNIILSPYFQVCFGSRLFHGQFSCLEDKLANWPLSQIKFCPKNFYYFYNFSFPLIYTSKHQQHCISLAFLLILNLSAPLSLPLNILNSSSSFLTLPHQLSHLIKHRPTHTQTTPFLPYHLHT